MNSTDIEKILFIDIETVPLVYRYHELEETARNLWNKKWQYNPNVTPEEHYQKAGIYAEFARVVCVCAGYYENKKFLVRSFVSDDEADILQRLSKFLKDKFSSPSHFLCAHNGKEFDFPFLCRRYLVHGIPLPKILQLQGLKPWEIKHLDTMDMWKFGDYKSFSSLDLLAHVFGLPSPKDDMDGSMVGKTYYEDKDLNRIETYCKKDVITLARVFNRFAGHSQLHDDDVIFA